MWLRRTASAKERDWDALDRVTCFRDKCEDLGTAREWLSPDISCVLSRGGLSPFVARHVRFATAVVFLTR